MDVVLLASHALRLPSGECPRDGAAAPVRECAEYRDRQPKRDYQRAHAHAVARPDRDAYPNANGRAKPDANPYSRAKPDANPYSRAKPNAHPNARHPDAHADRDAPPHIDNRHAKRALGDDVPGGAGRSPASVGDGVRRRDADVQMEKARRGKGARLALH